MSERIVPIICRVLRKRILKVIKCVLWPVRPLATRQCLRGMTRANTSLMQLCVGMQMTPDELMLLGGCIERIRPCRVLVFGLGYDSSFWRRLNHGGETVFLEDNLSWIASLKRHDPSLIIHQIEYNSKIDDADKYLDRKNVNYDTWPEAVTSRSYDLIFVDAPVGHSPGYPGRMLPIIASAKLAGANGHVFVHDCDRDVESRFSDQYLGPNRTMHQVGRLRHYGPIHKVREF